MANAKPILYGVSDFVLMRTEGAYYIDRTAYIRELEKNRYVMFLRPRRFGKSLLVSMLQCYYDVHYAARFDELFAGLAIHDNPTPGHGKYLILDFNFTGVEKQIGLVQDSFNDISLAPQLERYPEIGWAMLIELKYLKKEDDVSSAALAAIRKEAIAQLDRYAANNNLARAWGLESSGGHVKLVRLVIVFQGGDRVLCETA